MSNPITPVVTKSAIQLVDFWYIIPLALAGWWTFTKGRQSWDQARTMMFSPAALMIWFIWTLIISGALCVWIMFRVKVMGDIVQLG